MATERNLEQYDIFQRKLTEAKTTFGTVILKYGETHHILIKGIQFTITVCLFVLFLRLKKTFIRHAAITSLRSNSRPNQLDQHL